MAMKTLLIISCFLLVNCFVGFAQIEPILLHPENGKEYFYQFTDLQYIANDDGLKLSELRKQKTLHIKFSNVQSENKELLQVVVIQNKADKPLRKPIETIDYMYPYLEDTYFGKRYDNYYEELICDIEFQFEFDYATSEVKLYNRADVLLKVREILKRKEFDKKGIDRYTTEFNEKGIPEITKRLNSIYRISMDSEPEINNTEEFKTKVIVKDSFGNISAKRWDKTPGLYSLNILSHLKEYYLKNYNRIEIDSTKQNGWAARNPDKRFYHENDIRLLRQKNISENRFTISGKIENPKYKKVTLAVLKNPYGTELHQESVFLDENNTFQIETELNHPGIVMLQFGNTNQSRELPIFLIYAEPGSRIELNDGGETFLENVEFEGDFSNAAKMLCEFRKKHKLVNNLNLETTFWQNMNHKVDYADFEVALKDFDSFSEAFKNEIDETAFEFIEKEMKAQFFSGSLLYSRQKETYLNDAFARPYFKDYEKVDIQFLQRYIENNSINELYNEFGIYSRIMAGVYLASQLEKTVQTQKLHKIELDYFIVLSSGILYPSSYLNLELLKVILSGHAYYSSVAKFIQYHKTHINNQLSKNNQLLIQKADEYSDLAMRLCNNLEFVDALKSLNTTHNNWESSDYIPPNKFFNDKGEQVYLKSFFGEKPTVFYVVQNWGTERYYFDDLANENPAINFVMIMEGSNFQEWTDYMERAEPVANQLFFINTEKELKSIFKKDYRHFIVYDKNGIRFAFASNPLDAKNFAKQSLQPPKKKELNKSQLQLIIILLGSILCALIIGLTIWKWRVRQRFRKEEQHRKLRELELTAIRSQMNPHFLFNALNSVQNLVQQNKGREAHLYLADFAGLIRKVLNNSEKEEVSLAEELEMIEQYLNLEKLRFDFEFVLSVSEEIDSHNTLVPSMLLQPFVENAVIHGLQSKEGYKRLKIEILKSDLGINIGIEDNGIGRAAAKEIAKAKNGKGTKLMKERLEILQEKQGEKYSLEIVDLKEGTRVEIVIPEES